MLKSPRQPRRSRPPPRPSSPPPSLRWWSRGTRATLYNSSGMGGLYRLSAPCIDRHKTARRQRPRQVIRYLSTNSAGHRLGIGQKAFSTCDDSKTFVTAQLIIHIAYRWATASMADGAYLWLRSRACASCGCSPDASTVRFFHCKYRYGCGAGWP